jgi:autotransporter-associated beta strand protein
LNYTGTLRGSGALNISAGSQVVTLGSANHHAGGTTNTSGQLVLLNNLSAGTGPVTFLSSGSVRPGTGTVITNAFHFNSTTDYMMDTTNGDATWAGPIIPLSGAASFRPGGTAGKLTLTGTAALGNRNFIIPKGSVDLGGNANFSATGTATAFGRNSTANSAFVTIRDNAIVSLGRLNLGGDENTGGRVTVTIRDNGYLSTGLENFDLHLSDRTATYTLVSLDGGTLAVGGFIKTRTGAAQLTTNYFNGGLLLATKANSALLPALSGLTCYVQTGGAKIYDSGFGIGIAAPLLHDPALGAVLDGGLVKSGSGTLTLTGTNTYTGGTIVSNGMLILSSNGSISNTAFIRVDAGATLHANNTIGTTLPVPKGFLIGNGAILGHVRIMNTATISPGFNGIGRLSCNHGVTLDPGATSVFELAKASATNDVLKVYPTANLGGTITVTNLSGPLSAGDSFKLIDAPSYSGSFATVNLPALPPGLAWTNQLATSGNIAVISTAPANPPVFGAVSASGSNLVMSGSNGTPNASFYTLAATNVALPAANWSRVATNQFDANGYFNLTNPIDPAIPQLFYRLQLP